MGTIYVNNKEFVINSKEIKTTDDELQVYYEVIEGVLDAYDIEKTDTFTRQAMSETIAIHLNEINLLVGLIKK